MILVVFWGLGLHWF